MAGSEIVDAPCVSMSLERMSGTRIGYTDSIGWVRFDSFPDLTNINDYDERNEIYNRIFKFCCTDLNVSVRLYYIDGNDIIDCGRLESAASLRCDSNPVPQTNLGLTSLYSLLLLDGSYLWIDYP